MRQFAFAERKDRKIDSMYQFSFSFTEFSTHGHLIYGLKNVAFEKLKLSFVETLKNFLNDSFFN